ncbi:MAG: hypothetical protein QOF59_1345, partial [Actinomycetota bacterium]|nr:hypothetical protein [Actinomycetota bacterium]
MTGWQPSNSDSSEARIPVGPTPITGVLEMPFAGPADVVVDTTLLDLLPHPVFAIAVDGDDVFRFIYTNDSYRALLANDSSTGDLRHVVPANALVAHVRAFAAAARELRTVSFEAEWGSTPPRRVAVDV